MANCTVSGTFTNPQGTAVSGATVRFSTQKPLLDLSGNLVMPKEITTTTATDGSWSLSIIQSIDGTLTLDLNPTANSPVVKYSFSLIIPATTTATFASCWVDSGSFGGQSASSPLTFADISGVLAVAQLPALPSGDIFVGNGSGAAAAVALSGDGTLSSAGALTVGSVGGSTAANVHSAELLANAATNSNTASTIVKRDASGNFSAGTITASLTGHASLDLQAASNLSDVADRQTSLNTLIGSVASGTYLRGGGANASMTAIQVADVPTLNQNTTGTAGNVTGTVAILNGGTGQTTQQAAINALTGAQSSGKYLRSDGVNSSLTTIQAGDVPTLNQNTTGTSSNVTGTVAIVNGGTGQTTASAAFNALSPITLTGDLIVGNGASSTTRLAKGTQYQVLQANATTAAYDAVHLDQSAAVTGVLPNANTTAASANTVSTIVARDGSGNFSAGTITAALAGNATTATTASTVTTNANLTGDVTSSGNATTYSGTVPLNKGGTGQTTKAAAFDALSPMSASGDIIYGGASGTGTRLPKGSDTQVLTLASGVPTWATASSSGTGGYWSGYFTGSGTNYWNTTSASYGNWTLPASIPTLNELQNSGFGTVIIAGASNNQPGLHFTAQRTGLLMIHFSPFVNPPAGENISFQLWESGTSTIINECGGVITTKANIPCFGLFSVTASTVYNIYLRAKTTASTLNIGAVGSTGSQLSMTMFYLT